MKRMLSVLAVAAVALWGLDVSAQTSQRAVVRGAKGERGIRVHRCCPCAKVWPYRQLQNPSLALVENQPLQFRVAPDGWMDAYISVKNVSAETVTFSVRIDTSRKHPDHRVNFCSGSACYPTFVVQADEQGYVTLEPGQVDHTFKLQFDAQGSAGQTTIGVTMFNIANPNDYISFDVTFDAEVLSVPDELATVVVSPNPASDYIRLNAPAGAHVELVDLLGRSVRQMQLQSDQVIMSVGDLPVGSYRVIVHGTGRVVSLPLQVLR